VFPCYIDAPDQEFGGFQGAIRLTGEPAVQFVETIDGIYEGWLKQLKAENNGKKVKANRAFLPYFTNETKPWADIGKVAQSYIDELQDGEVIVKARLNEVIPMGDGGERKMAPKIFDASGQLIAGDLPLIGAGSKACIAGQMNAWFNAGKGAGLSLWMEAVQLIELVEKGGVPKDAEGFGFESTDGFETEKVETFDEVAAGEDDNKGDF
jgi:hypothetical protein